MQRWIHTSQPPGQHTLSPCIDPRDVVGHEARGGHCPSLVSDGLTLFSAALSCLQLAPPGIALGKCSPLTWKLTHVLGPFSGKVTQ